MAEGRVAGAAPGAATAEVRAGRSPEVRWARRALELPGQAGLPAPLGATLLEGGRCRFVVWAPRPERLELRLAGPGGEDGRVEPLEPGPRGYWSAEVGDVPPGTRYLFRLPDGRELPDPASRSQPDGVHGPSEVVDPGDFAWHDDGWTGPELARQVFYELHVGTYTAEGTFDAAASRLGELVDLGVTTVELMPLSQFPGSRNWGYDGVYPFAVQASYGGPRGLQRFVDAAHETGLAVCLDVVYNHFGPEGAYHSAYAPYFTDRYATPWGAALNFDGASSDEVRRYFLESALYYVSEFHVDAFRLDAVDTIVDASPVPFLADLAGCVHALAGDLGRRVHLICEDDRNAAGLVRPREEGGQGLDGEWNDDFHHALHALVTGERGGYYGDFGEVEHLARAMRDGFVYEGERSEYRGRRQGSPAADLPAERFVVFSQNHDQVGNRAASQRLRSLAGLDAARLAAAAVLLSPYPPLLFMGEEYGEPAPFPYFISHGDPDLVEAVRKGRREEFSAFDWSDPPADPQSESTFASARLDHDLKREPEHAAVLGLYRELLRLRRELPALARSGKGGTEARVQGRSGLLVRRSAGDERALVAFNFAAEPVELRAPLPAGRWERRLDAAEERWGGPGSRSPELLETEGSEVALPLAPWAATLYERVSAP